MRIEGRLVAVFGAVALAAACGGSDGGDAAEAHETAPPSVATGGEVVAEGAVAESPVAGTEIVVYRDESCACCERWATHLKTYGFDVKVEDAPDMTAVKAAHGVTPQLVSCHTATVDGYVIEGHVPADVIERLLRERPDVQGLAVPGMPIGSPGMEMPGRPADSYEVLAFDAEGNTEVYAER